MRPDLIVVTGGIGLPAEGCSALIRKGFRVVLWTTDLPRADDVMQATACDYHDVFCQGTEYVEIFRELGIAGPGGCPWPAILSCTIPSICPKRRGGVSAAMWPLSDPITRGVRTTARAGGLGSPIWGPGWGDAPNRHPRSGPSSGGRHTPPRAWIQDLLRRKIVLSIHIQDPMRQFRVFQASPRVFEALACGAFVLTDRQQDVLSLFKDGEHLASLSDGSDLQRQKSSTTSPVRGTQADRRSRPAGGPAPSHLRPSSRALLRAALRGSPRAGLRRRCQ